MSSESSSSDIITEIFFLLKNSVAEWTVDAIIYSDVSDLTASE